MPSPDPTEKWLINFSKKTYGWSFDGGGRPWGDGTKMAEREKDGKDPWDEGCEVSPLIGGYEAMSAMRESLETAIGEAPGLPPDQRGYVYIADWRLNAFRDLSETNDWGTDPWPNPPGNATVDETAIGLVLRLMQAGIRVRILVWLPLSGWTVESLAGFKAHVEDHIYLARVVARENSALKTRSPELNHPLGVVALDTRVAEIDQPAAAHHQKMMIIRVGHTQVAFCGGVDLAYTRRDAPSTGQVYNPNSPQFLSGDWQSSGRLNNITNWPRQTSGVNYGEANRAGVPSDRQSTDLPVEVYGDSSQLNTRQIWHDQHLQLKGPIVATLEHQFRERWLDTTAEPRNKNVRELPDKFKRWQVNQVYFSSKDAFDSSNSIRDDLVPPPSTIPQASGSSYVQMWRTIPLRTRSAAPFTRGEFTVMAGIAKACKQAQRLIWIFDQYFWSRPLALLLNSRLRQEPQNLYVLIILPPCADGDTLNGYAAVRQHWARWVALNILTQNLSQSNGEFDHVGVYNLWHPTRNLGIYCHAKAQMYDGSLLVCGSANLNRRSFTCDTELACAVLDPAVVHNHQQRLWKLLFPNVPWVEDQLGHSINWDNDDSGKTFFQLFRQAARSTGKFLTPDPWRNPTPTLPNNQPRDQHPIAGKPQDFYNNVLDPSSLTLSLETSGGDDILGLDKISDRIEKEVSISSQGQITFPWRRRP